MNRNRFIKVRVSDSEQQQIKVKAEEAGLTVSDLMRYRTLGTRLRKTSVDRERIRQLARIGSNLNQLARWVNSRKDRVTALEVLLWLNRLSIAAREIVKTEGEKDAN